MDRLSVHAQVSPVARRERLSRAWRYLHPEFAPAAEPGTGRRIWNGLRCYGAGFLALQGREPLCHANIGLWRRAVDADATDGVFDSLPIPFRADESPRTCP